MTLSAELRRHAVNERHISKHQRGETVRLCNLAADELERLQEELRVAKEWIADIQSIAEDE